MQVTVRYLAQAREATGRATEELRLDGPTTVLALLQRLARLHGEAFARLALHGSDLPHPALLVAIGDERVRCSDPRTLAAGDTVTIMTPISGG